MTRTPEHAERRRRDRGSAGQAPVLLAAAMAAVCLVAAPARAWNDDGHVLITGEAVARLPEPLRGLLSEGDSLARLQRASAEPDDWRKPASPHYSPAEKPRHFFDINAITTEAAPFRTFPRRLADIEAQFGPEVLDREGRGPWAVRDAMRRLTDALIQGRTEDFFRAAGEASHYAADLHMPFHTTKNYDGKLTGNPGVHAALEVGLMNRCRDFYAAEIVKGRGTVLYLPDPEGSTLAWVIQAHGLVPVLLEADAAARKKTGYDPKEHEKARKDGAGNVVDPSDLDNLDSERAKPYYATVKEELEARGSPLAAQMREASAHVAQLFYTAWTDAGKPLSLAAPEAPATDELNPWLPLWALGAVAMGLLVVLLPRRRPTPK
jgi:hypothetical protein